MLTAKKWTRERMQNHESIGNSEPLHFMIYAGVRQGRVLLEILNGAFEDRAQQGVPDLERF
jgi:hypothetical protein